MRINFFGTNIWLTIANKRIRYSLSKAHSKYYHQLKGYLHVIKASTKRLHVIKVSIATVFVTGNNYFQNLELLERFDHIASLDQNKFKKILNLKVGIEQIVVDEQSRTLITLKPSWKRIHICKMSTSKRKKEHKKLKQQRAKVYTVIFELTTLASIVAWRRDETRSSLSYSPSFVLACFSSLCWSRLVWLMNCFPQSCSRVDIVYVLILQLPVLES